MLFLVANACAEGMACEGQPIAHALESCKTIIQIACVEDVAGLLRSQKLYARLLGCLKDHIDSKVLVTICCDVLKHLFENMVSVELRFFSFYRVWSAPCLFQSIGSHKALASWMKSYAALLSKK